MARLSRARSVATAAVNANLLLFAFADEDPALASDLGASPNAHVAAVSTDPAVPKNRLEGLGSDEIWVLAQSAATAAGQSEGDGVLALFDASAPETVENEVARAYGLELVSRLTVPTLEKRMVRFRIPDGRSIAEVVAVLRADQRVSSAQPNFHYHFPNQSPIAIGKLQQHSPRARHAKGVAPAERAVDARTAKVPTLQRPGSLVADNQRSLRWPTADEPFVNLGVRNR